MREYMTEKEIDDLVKEIMKFPKVESNNPVSTMYGFDVDTLINTLRDFKRLPTYDEVLKQNQQLKEKLQQKEDIINKAKVDLEKHLNAKSYGNHKYELFDRKYLEEVLEILNNKGE